MSSVERKKYVDMTRYVGEVADLTIEEAASVVEGNAVTLAPVDTGNLRNSIYKKRISDVEAEVGATVEYAIYQEFGTRKMQAQPFLRPALDSLRNRLARIWADKSRRFKR